MGSCGKHYRQGYYSKDLLPKQKFHVEGKELVSEGVIFLLASAKKKPISTDLVPGPSFQESVGEKQS